MKNSVIIQILEAFRDNREFIFKYSMVFIAFVWAILKSKAVKEIENIIVRILDIFIFQPINEKLDKVEEKIKKKKKEKMDREKIKNEILKKK